MTAALRQRFRDSTIQRFNLSIANHQHACRVDLRLLRRIAEALLTEHLSVQKCHLGVCLIAAPEMTRLNETFVHHAGSTDVITFDYVERAAQAPRLPNSARVWSADRRNAFAALHGEIFICADAALIQARRFRTSWQSEIVRYLIHGLLHLLGYDDKTIAARGQMKREESRLLREMAARFPLSKLGRKPKIRT